MKVLAVAAALSLLASSVGAQPAPSAAGSNPEMLRLLAEDQADRQTPTIDWSVVSPRDTARRAATRKLLADGALHTGEDYSAAAFVFQHGGSPDDYLLAHTLAVVAVGKGKRDAIWIAAATLDRYLQNTSHPQIYGTQYSKAKAEAEWSQEPYDRQLISDALREELRVPPLAEQEKRRQAMAALKR